MHRLLYFTLIIPWKTQITTYTHKIILNFYDEINYGGITRNSFTHDFWKFLMEGFHGDEWETLS